MTELILPEPALRERSDDEDRVVLPTLHADQVRCWEQQTRFYAVRCGRRWGKTKLGEAITCDGAVKAQEIGYFTPDHKRWSEVYVAVEKVLYPIIARRSKTTGEIRTNTGGSIDFWTLDDENAGRGRKYHLVIIDEAAFTKPNMLQIWKRAIRPTLVDYRGACLVLSNTNGIDPENFLYQICHDPKLGFREYHAPTWANPMMPAEEIAELRAGEHPLVFSQEYAAEFVDWSGVAFFERDKWLVGGKPVDVPVICDSVFAVIDTATKTGKLNDGTAVVYFARTKTPGLGYPLVVLDHDVTQIEGRLLEEWLPSVFANLQHWAKTCRARMGSAGAFIEDKSTGMVLLQQAKAKKLPATPIDGKLTSMGKSERAINVSGHHYRGEVKMTAHAYDKVTTYKGVTRNHLIGQVCGFRVGNKDKNVADDLLDGYTYGIALALGNAEGF